MFQSDFGGAEKKGGKWNEVLVANHSDSIYFNAERHDRMLRHSTNRVTT